MPTILKEPVDRFFIHPDVKTSMVKKIVTAIKNSAFWDKQTKKFKNTPKPTNKPTERASDTTQFLNELGDVIRAAYNARGQSTVNNKREWKAAGRSNAPLVLRTASDATILCELHLSLAKTHNNYMITKCTVAANDLLYSHPDRSRATVLLLCGTTLHVFVADRVGCVWVAGPDLAQKWTDKELKAFVNALLGLYHAPATVLGFDSTITVGQDGKYIIVAPNTKYRVLEVLGTKEDWAYQGAITRRAKAQDSDEVLLVTDTWVTKKEISRDQLVHRSVRHTEGVADVLQRYVVSHEEGSVVSTAIVQEVDIEPLMHYRKVSRGWKRLSDFGCLEELLSVFIDYLNIHKELYERIKPKGCLIPDVNLADLVIDETRKQTVNGKTVGRGLLMNFGGAFTKEGHHIREFKGCATSNAYPFASRDSLLARSRQTPYHPDFSNCLESLFIILVTICLSVDGVDEPRKRSSIDVMKDTLGRWRHSPLLALDSRTEIFATEEQFRTLMKQTMAPYFAPLEDVLSELHLEIIGADDLNDTQVDERTPEYQKVVDILEGALDVLGGKERQSRREPQVTLDSRPATTIEPIHEGPKPGDTDNQQATNEQTTTDEQTAAVEHPAIDNQTTAIDKAIAEDQTTAVVDDGKENHAETVQHESRATKRKREEEVTEDKEEVKPPAKRRNTKKGVEAPVAGRSVERRIMPSRKCAKK